MADIILEIDEALKQERFEKFWKKHGLTVVVLLLIVIAGTAINAGYKAWIESINRDQTNKMIEAIESKEPQKSLIETAKNLNPGLRSLSLFSAAGYAIKANETEKAAELLTEIINDKNVTSELRSLAKYQNARLLIAKDPQKALILLQEIAESKTNPWKENARLDASVIMASHFKKYKDAKEYLTPLTTNMTLPQTLSRKAQSLSILYGLEASGTPEVIPQQTENSVNVTKPKTIEKQRDKK